MKIQKKEYKLLLKLLNKGNDDFVAITKKYNTLLQEHLTLGLRVLEESKEQVSIEGDYDKLLNKEDTDAITKEN